MIAPRPTIEEILRAVAISDNEPARQALVSLQTAPAVYIRLLSGTAAWVAAISLIACLALAGLLQNDTKGASLMLGLCCCLGAVGLRWVTRESESTFFQQLALSVSIAGQNLFFWSLWAQTNSWSSTALGGALLQLGLLVGYPDALHRFLSASLASLLLGVWLHHLFPVLPLHLVSVPLLAGAIALSHWEPEIEIRPWAAFRAPVAFGLILALFNVLIFARWAPETQAPLLGLTTMGLCCLVGGLGWLVQRECDISSSWVRWGLPLGLLLLGGLTWSTPGVVAALGTMILAFHRRSVLLLGLGAIFQALFLVALYYDLSLSLLLKSTVLVTSGLLLLGIRMRMLALGARP